MRRLDAPARSGRHGRAVSRTLRQLATASEEGVPPEEEVIIAIAELITYLALASASAELWHGRLVLYTGDNMNVHQWLESRSAGNALARWLLRILGALEATHSFQTISAYFRTYHNVTADSLTRDKCEEVDELLQRHGLTLLDAKPDWALHLDRDWTRRVIAWHGQDPGDQQVALQLAERRQGLPLPAVPTPRPAPRPGEKLQALEWRATLGTYAMAALGQGVFSSLVPLKGGPSLESPIWPPTIRRSREQEARTTDCLLASFTEDPSGEEARRFASVVAKTGARVFWVDAPAKANLQPLTSLRSQGWKVAELDVDFGELGEPTNTRRRIVAACRDDLEPWILDDLASLCAPPRDGAWLEKAKSIPDDAWITGDRELFTGKILPSPSGHPSSGHIKPVGRLKEGPEGQYYFDPSKQLPTLRKTSWQEGDEALLLAQEGKVRRIQPVEVWRLKGGTTPAWRSALAEGHTPDELATWAVRTPSLGAASVGAAWCVATLRNSPSPGRDDRHAGVCPLPDEEEAWAALKGWLAARAIADGVRRVGGPRKRTGAPPSDASRRGIPADNADPYRLSKILVAILRTKVVQLRGDDGGWVSLQSVQDTVAARRIGASLPRSTKSRPLSSPARAG